MFSLLLIVIYLSFISLGLPDSLLGAAWPSMQPLLGVPVSYAGWLSMIISCGTVISSLLSDKLLRRFGTGLVVSCSVLLTAIALFGYSISSHYGMLCLFAIPYGLGAGAVDAALNHYVALHYASRHMSWLHCFWGVGCALSPYIMSFYLHRNTDWQGGYRAISVLQLGLTVMLFLSLPLWKKQIAETESGEKRSAKPIRKLLRQHGAVQALLTFFSYCALESTAGLWASSFLVQSRGITAETAARFASLFYIGITAGRFLSGFIADRFGDRRMIRFGLCGITSGVFLILLPLPQILTLTGLIVIGFGCAPVYPCMIHATPAVFGREASQQMIGLQMAFAYIGTTLMPPLFGFIADRAGLGMLPLFLAFFLVLMALLTEQMYQTKRN
ncbi:MAG: MFS transporter [Oscillospiraceae bacterium]|nr:MFS transporter [Oscillospiraceae bacterium]